MWHWNLDAASGLRLAGLVLLLAALPLALRMQSFWISLSCFFLLAVQTAVLAPAPNGGSLPVLEGRDVPAGAVAYVCVDMVCERPAHDVETFRDQLAG